MPTNTQRVTAVLATGAIVLAGGWLANLASSSPAVASEETQETAAITSAPDAVTPASETPPPAPSQGIDLTISGVRSGSGTIYAMLFDDPEAFASYDYQRAADMQMVPAKTGPVSISFTGLANKPYAIAIFHDENSNEEFDMVGGYPAEGYGTSRASNAYDDLTFDQASVRAGPANVRMHYLQ